jgi:branched-chain amino acid transport system permease protein
MRASLRSGKSSPGVIGRRGLAYALYATAALAAVVVALITPLSAYSLNLLMQAATYAIAVLGLTIVLGFTGQINLAQAAFFGIGAYGVALGTTAFGLSFWGALAIGALLAAGAGAVLGLTSLRLGGHYLAMVTISFQTILTLVLTNWVAFTRGPDGVPNIRRPPLLAESGPYLGLCIAALFAVAWLVWRLKTTKLGRAMQAVRDNELAANVIGVDAYATKVAAFTLSAVLGGFGGALFAGGFTYVSPDQFSFAESVVFLTMVLLGGAAAPAGAVLGTGLLILLPEWLRFLKVIYLAVYGGAVILIMIFMPDGIWGFATTSWRRLRPARPIDPGIIAPLALTRETARPDDSVILSVQGLSRHFGGLKAVDEVDLTIRRNTVHALIGPNGSGKTTLLNVLNGIVRPTAGSIVLDGVDITRLPPHRRAGHGLGRTFQNIRLFAAMSVLDNVIVAAERPPPLPTLPRKRGRGGWGRHRRLRASARPRHADLPLCAASSSANERHRGCTRRGAAGVRSDVAAGRRQRADRPQPVGWRRIGRSRRKSVQLPARIGRRRRRFHCGGADTGRGPWGGHQRPAPACRGAAPSRCPNDSTAAGKLGYVAARESPK